MERRRSVVVAPHQEVDTVVADQVDEAMFLGDPSRPDVGPEMLDGFGLSDALERVAHDGFNEFEESKSSLSIRLHPELKVLPELVLEDGNARSRRGVLRTSLLRGQARSSGLR